MNSTTKTALAAIAAGIIGLSAPAHAEPSVLDTDFFRAGMPARTYYFLCNKT